MADLKEKYNNLRIALTKDRFDKAGADLSIGDYSFDKELREAAVNLINEVEKELDLRNNHTPYSSIQSNKDDDISKAWWLCFEYFNIVGISRDLWISDLQKINLKSIQKDFEESLRTMFNNVENRLNPEYIANVLIHYRMLLQLGEIDYRNNQFPPAYSIFNHLQSKIFQHFSTDHEHYLPLLMMSLTENTVLELRENYRENFEVPLQNIDVSERADFDNVSDEVSWLNKGVPKIADEFLILLSYTSLCLGKTLIRWTINRPGEIALGDSMKSLEVWRKIRLSRLWAKYKEQEVSNVIQEKVQQQEKDQQQEKVQHKVKVINNYVLFGSALAQSYLAFSSYRRGKFTQAVNLMTLARSVLDKSNWLWTKIFADLIYSGGNRRLAGISNRYLLLESRQINQKIIDLYEEDDNEALPPKFDSDFDRREFTFKLRALYELGINFYYFAELEEYHFPNFNENKLRLYDSQCFEESEPQSLLALIEEYLNKAEDKVKLIKDHFNLVLPRDEEFRAFWLANALHLSSFIQMKRAVLKQKYEKRSFNELDGESKKIIEKFFDLAEQEIEQAERFSEKANSWWQRTEIQTDKAFILNESARYYSLNKNREKKIQLLGKSLNSINDAEEFANFMANSESEILEEFHKKKPKGTKQKKKFKPSAHFAGAISLVKSECYALLGQTEQSRKEFEEWKAISYKVEYTRVRDLVPRIEEEINRINISNSFVLNPDEDSIFDYKEQSFQLKKWLFENATSGRKDREAIKLLKIPPATFYKWRNEINDEVEKRKKNKINKS